MRTLVRVVFTAAFGCSLALSGCSSPTLDTTDDASFHSSIAAMGETLSLEQATDFTRAIHKLLSWHFQNRDHVRHGTAPGAGDDFFARLLKPYHGMTVTQIIREADSLPEDFSVPFSVSISF
ncbi:MAG: DUF6694 family lipoprotein [Pirellulales bacterium]